MLSCNWIREWRERPLPDLLRPFICVNKGWKMWADSRRQRTGGSLKMCKTSSATLEKVSGDGKSKEREKRSGSSNSWRRWAPRYQSHGAQRLKAAKVGIRGAMRHNAFLIVQLMGLIGCPGCPPTQLSWGLSSWFTCHLCEEHPAAHCCHSWKSLLRGTLVFLTALLRIKY